MLVEQRDFTLLGKVQRHAHISVIPTGKLRVNILEDNAEQEAEFSQLWFSRTGTKTLLVCRVESKVNWQLDLRNQDAKELEHLIESAQEDYEILMRDL
ncbi:hypothetical protein C9J44_14930 [Photobacterium sp. GB-27]|uniref:hypothetical protein n=1 Tax=unclassified Photobacterium TaxID=2628852 RepID=UPI000D157E20|nr:MULTISPECIES: hypothetical protein [unclassified Photobacterium]PSV26858.1 hypothetical protein C9J42_08295 [Photobacterium sp. GB-56]PSV30127.1 hypothetical protein C9J40_14325 [Photobacterium sp. GB-72]PSV34649.1 hypothetical protein C9J44_14930 [Photobacterium sp. GB-27]PSV54851.1 hypothetical protein C9J43_16760 [Photobacterium sp. GB-3]